MTPKKLSVWFCAFSKRLLQKSFFVILLCLFPLLSIVLNVYCQSEKPLIQIALFNEGNTQLADNTIQDLIKRQDTFHFYEVDSPHKLYEDVENTTAECGYIFTTDYKLENLLEEDSWQNTVRVIESPGSMLTGSINELVFSSFFCSYNETLLIEYLNSPGVLKEGQDTEKIAGEMVASYRNYALGDDILQPDKTTADSKESSKADLVKQSKNVTESFLTDMSRGILSVLILLAALCGALQLITDRKNGLFVPFYPTLQCGMELLEVVTPAVLMGISGMIGLVFLPGHQPLFKELAGLLIYIPATALFSYVVLNLTGSDSVFHSVIPLLTLGALIFPPVFMDFTVYAKVLTIPKYLFINSYYLEMVKGGSMQLVAALGILILLAGLVILLQKLTKLSKTNK